MRSKNVYEHGILQKPSSRLIRSQIRDCQATGRTLGSFNRMRIPE